MNAGVQSVTNRNNRVMLFGMLIAGNYTSAGTVTNDLN
jgi:hypothetical protein